MSNQKLSIYFALIISVILLDLYFPIIHIFNTKIKPDILLILLTVIGLTFGRFYAIIAGFCLGLIQDLSTQIQLIGTFTLIKSVFGYGIGTIMEYETIWKKNIKYGFLFLIYVLHFFIYFYVHLNNNVSWDIIGIIVLIQSLITIGIFWIINYLIYRSKLL